MVDYNDYLETLRQKFGHETVIRQMDGPDDNLPPVFCFIYEDTPEPGMITGVTYGLSFGSHPSWGEVRPELVIALESELEAWPLAMAFFAAEYRGRQDFSFGNIFTLSAPITEESEMTSLLVFAPSVLSQEQALLELPGGSIELRGLYPLFPGEVELVRDEGIESLFTRDGFSMYDVTRSDLSAE